MTLEQAPTSRPTFVPSDDWIDRFAEGYTPVMLKRVKRYVASRLGALARAGYPADDYAAEEMVTDALDDILSGLVHWDPGAKSLEQQLIDLLQARTKRARLRAEKYPRESLHGLLNGGREATADAVDRSLLEQAPRTATTEYAAHVMAELGRLAGDDPLVLRLLAAFSQGAVTRSDVMHVAAFSAGEYHNVRRRLDRLVAQLPVRGRASRAVAGGV